jgi:hypothetical protein
MRSLLRPLYTDKIKRRSFVMRVILWALLILSPLFALAQNYHWSLSIPRAAILQTSRKITLLAFSLSGGQGIQGASLTQGQSGAA